jgi:N-methylhydantoinase A
VSSGSPEVALGSRAIRIGVDVGGTFTDLVAIDGAGHWTVLKLPTTSEDPSVAVMEGIDRLLSSSATSTVAFLGHGTTAATNAFLTRRGARTALVSTAGFEDVLEFRRMDRSGLLDPYDLQIEPPVPLVPGRLRFGADERIGPEGDVEQELTDAELQRVVGALREAEPEAVAISLLWSFQNPEHERRVAAAIAAALPEAYVSVSHDVDPAIQEYERTSTTVLNAYLGPPIRRYFERFAGAAADRGLPAPTIMQSNGGMVSIRHAADRAAALLESGPAAGFTAASHLARRQGHMDLLAVDMGGTSFETALVLDGEPQQMMETEVEGHALRMPMLDIRSIGAGGGSIAWLDDGGALRVGPQSAGASPGPACYGRGGTAPTVSDANLVLGYLSELAGGALRLDRDAAAAALRRVGEPLGLGPIDTAGGIFRIVNARMADAMRLVASERGIDPSELVLMAYGGAGPTHAAALARELELRRTVIPPHPGALSALGVATGDLVHDYSDSLLRPLPDLDPEALAARLERLEQRGREALDDDGVEPGQQEFHRYYLGRYIGQLHSLDVPLDGLSVRDGGPDALAARFHERHQAAYGFAVDSETVFALSLRVRAIGRIPKPDFAPATVAETPAPIGHRDVWYPGAGFVRTPVYARRPWAPGGELPGPAVIDEYDSTTVVLPGQRWSSDATGSILIEEAS